MSNGNHNRIITCQKGFGLTQQYSGRKTISDKAFLRLIFYFILVTVFFQLEKEEKWIDGK